MSYKGEYTEAEYRRNAQKVLDRTKKDHAKYNYKIERDTMPRTVLFKRDGLKNVKEVTNDKD